MWLLRNQAFEFYSCVLTIRRNKSNSDSGQIIKETSRRISGSSVKDGTAAAGGPACHGEQSRRSRARTHSVLIEGARVRTAPCCSPRTGSLALKHFYNQPLLFDSSLWEMRSCSFLKGQINHNSVYKLQCAGGECADEYSLGFARTATR